MPSYVLATGCQWRALPRDFPPHSTEAFTGGAAVFSTRFVILRGLRQVAELRQARVNEVGQRRDDTPLVLALSGF